jgi:hypothetical protein
MDVVSMKPHADKDETERFRFSQATVVTSENGGRRVRSFVRRRCAGSRILT